MNYTFFSALLGIAAAISIFWFVRKNLLYVRYSLWWVLVGIVSGLLGIFPQFVNVAAKFFNIGYPPVIVLAGALVLLLVKILSMDIERSQQEIRLRRMVQRIALLQSVVEEQGMVVLEDCEDESPNAGS